MKLKHLTALALSMSSFSVLAQMQCSDVEQATAAQCENLKKIWDQTNGPNWSDAQTNNWMQTNNPCEWDGVHCWGSRVARLYLGNKNLEGQLPDLSDLPELRTISVHTNKLTGDLPDVTLNTKLEQLFIYNNDFSGRLPNFAALPNFKSLIVKNNALLHGPLVFNGNKNADLPVIYGTNLCRSNKIDYKHWAEAVASLPECQQYGANYELSWFGIMPNDGIDDSHGINNLLAMHYYGSGTGGDSLQLNFQAGTYELDSPIIIKYMNNVTLNGKLGYGGYYPSEHTRLVKSEKFVPLWDKQLGAMISIFGSRETTIQNISFEGVTESLTDINVKDHGITNVNSCLTQIKDSNFSNFGYSAISDFSIDEDMTGKPCNGPGVSTLIDHNKFNNVCYISSASDWLSTYGLTIEENQFENLKCGLKLHSPRAIAETVMSHNPLLTVRNNTISGPGADYSGYVVGISVSGYDNVLIEGNVVKNGPGFGIAVWAYQNDYTQHDFDWAKINILNNELENNKSGILLFNQAKPSGFQPTLSNARIENNKILSSWHSMVGPHIHVIGSAFNNVSISNNEMYGGLHGVWTPQGEYGIFEHNFFQPSNTFNLASYQFIGPQLLSDPSVNNSNHWWVPKTDIFSDNAMKIVQPYAPLKNGQHDQAWSVVKAPVETGKRYLFHADMKTVGSGAAKGAVMVQFRNADGSFHSNSNSERYYNGVIGSYEPVGVSFVVPEGAATVKVGVYVYENEYSSSVYFDNFSLVEVAP